MSPIFRVAASVLAVAVLALPASAWAQDTAAIAGLWKGTVLSPEGQHPIAVVVAEQDGRLVGVVSGGQGQVPVEGTRTGDSINLRFSVDYQGAPLPITLSARPTADGLSGTADFGGQAQGTWSASRVAATGVCGAWVLSADDGSGPVPGVLTLLEENGAVRGRLLARSRGVDGVVSGTHANGTLTLKVQATVDGDPITIDMPGKAQGEASLAGTFAVGDITGRWTATRP